ncbi:hypothetical protein [Sediminivirga luteola]|uniref:Protein ImuA n=1 Tax=Sediminivirga luteola TaxID=1774748 RepID=A0A8J2TWT3_9MICO|nr:hypothetical protein [Sediminivirga luteola]MCI2263949.1 DNA recombination/repair protein RecA [Sediminivirga luteola]GGA08894.1 hypothetical protein GCM10011333_09850 [Sediminivirga luteola]
MSAEIAPIKARRLAERFGLGTASGVLSGAEMLPVLPALAELLPQGGLRRGRLYSLSGPGSLMLAFALAAEGTRRGHWCTALTDEELGLSAVADLGIRLDRLAVASVPGGEWLEALGILVDAVDIVIAQPGFRPAPREQQRLLARVRERRAIVLLLDDWPGAQDLRLGERQWEGLEAGAGRLRRCRRQVRTPTGQHALWLPDEHGGVSPAPSAEVTLLSFGKGTPDA